MLDGFNDNLLSLSWWIGEFASLAFFGWIIGWIVSQFVDWREKRRAAEERQEFENWFLETNGFDDQPQEIYWEDVRRFLTSEFELWKWVKSSLSSVLQVKARTSQDAKDAGWLIVDRSNRRVYLDYNKIPPRHVERWYAKPSGLVKTDPVSESPFAPH